MKPISPFGLPLGISFTFWTIIGFLRFLQNKIHPNKYKRNRFYPFNIAAVIPAHNEELVIRKCIKSLKEVLKEDQIYVVSDGSNDKTEMLARYEGVHVSRLSPGRGKARALKYLFNRYKLFKRYRLIFIVDADTNMDPACLKHSLPLFNDKSIKVVFASSQIKWKQHLIPNLPYYFITYRDRLNRMLQYCFVYGQTWKYTNVNYVIPGFATIYRSSTLKKLEIDTPGILIEDFNLAFQFHKKHLGKIGYAPTMIGWDQYPTTLLDYWNQVSRWNIGFFQTVKKNGVWPSFFWTALGVFSIEVILNSIFVFFIPIYLILSAFKYFNIQTKGTEFLTLFLSPLFGKISLFDIFLSIFIIDYAITIIIGIANKKPQYLFYGLFFFIMHFITSLILVTSIIPGFFKSSDGRWVSPKRLEKG